MSNFGISILVAPPVFSGRIASFPPLSDSVLDYNHEINAFGGYRKADFSFSATPLEAEEWFEDGLGRDITVYDDAQSVIWSGFVNSIDLILGGRTVMRGPLMEVSNRVKVVYSTIDASVVPPVIGMRSVTPAANDVLSQSRYGILEEIYSTSGCSDANALLIRDTLLNDNKEPSTSEVISIEQGNVPAVRVHCMGYIDYLGRFSYNASTTGNTNASSKIQAILAADPNAAISVGRLETNILQVPAYEKDDRRGLEIIKGIVAKGDASGNRWIFGIYGERKAYYQQAPETYEYQFSNTMGIVQTIAGAEVKPYNVLPGKWVFSGDFLVTRTIESVPLADPRATFIESVTYTAPSGLSINGIKNKQLSQLLARLGLGGTA